MSHPHSGGGSSHHSSSATWRVLLQLPILSVYVGGHQVYSCTLDQACSAHLLEVLENLKATYALTHSLQSKESLTNLHQYVKSIPYLTFPEDVQVSMLQQSKSDGRISLLLLFIRFQSKSYQHVSLSSEDQVTNIPTVFLLEKFDCFQTFCSTKTDSLNNAKDISVSRATLQIKENAKDAKIEY